MMFHIIRLALIAASISQACAVKLTLLEHGERIEDQYIVAFGTDPASTVHFNELKANWTSRFAEPALQIGDALGLNMLSVRLTNDELAVVEEFPGIDYIEHDMVMNAHQTTQQNPIFNLDRIDQTTGRDGQYTYLSDGSGVDCFILDTGVDTRHAGWSGNPAEFFVDCTSGSCNSNRDPGDPQSHGTHVAGTVASPEFGVAKRCRIRSVRVLGSDGSGSTTGIIAGVNAVVTEAGRTGRPSVINMSLGGGANRGTNDACANAVRTGVVVVVAAGNENQDARNVSPASEPLVITVGSSDINDRRSSFSNFGTLVDIFAPGSSITSLRTNTDSATLTISGTSMASPHVAGAAAQLLQADPSRTPAEVAEILVATASANVLSDPRGSPNLLLNVADERFGVDDDNVEETLPETDAIELTSPPIVVSPDVPETGADLSTFGALGDRFTAGLQSAGVMFDLFVDSSQLDAGQTSSLATVTVYSVSEISGVAEIYFTTDRRTYTNVASSSAAWSLLTNSNGQSQVSVISSGTTTFSGFPLFESVIVLPEPLELVTNTAQGIYVTFTSGDNLVTDWRFLPNNQVIATDGVVSLLTSRAVGARFSSTQARSGVIPLAVLSYSRIISSLDEPAPIEIPDEARLNDQYDCMTSSNDDESVLNMQNGVMFDLTVNELAAADLPGVWLESFSVFLVDSIQDGVAEVYTTVNGESYDGQETDSSAWRLIGTAENLTKDLEEGSGDEQEAGDEERAVDDNFLGDPEDVNDIERPSVPGLLDLDLELGFQLRVDGTPQGFYVTFRNSQMEYYADEQLLESSTLASTEFVTMTGGKGVIYPFEQAFERRQFAGEACFSYGETESRSSAPMTSSSPFVVLVVASMAALSLF